jgi:hypothetical protein
MNITKKRNCTTRNRKTTHYQLYSDPESGWLKVTLKELNEFNLLNSISHFSFINDQYAFLLENKDAEKFIEQKKKTVKEFVINRSSTLRYSKIRNYEPFTPSFARLQLNEQFLNKK